RGHRRPQPRIALGARAPARSDALPALRRWPAAPLVHRAAGRLRHARPRRHRRPLLPPRVAQRRLRGAGFAFFGGAAAALMASVALAAAASSPKPKVAVNLRPTTCATRKAMLMRASASPRAIAAPRPGRLSPSARQRVIRLTVTAMRPPSSGWCVPLLAHLHRSLKDGQVRHDCKPVARLARRVPDASCASRTARRSAAAQSSLFRRHHGCSASLLRVTPSDEATVRKPTTMARSRSEMRAIARRKRCRGLSTIDVLAGSGLTLMTMGTVFAFSQAQLKALATQSSYAQSQNVTRTAIDLMTRELRMASLDPTNLAL